MKTSALLACVALVLAGCGGPQAASPASPSAAVASDSPISSESPSPTDSPAGLPDPKLTCTTLPVPRDPLVLIHSANGLSVVDVSDPLHPSKVCQLISATSGRFISATKIAFWYATFVGTADLQTGSTTWSRAWVDTPLQVAFSPDGSSWAYEQHDVTVVNTHLVSGGKDTVLLGRSITGLDNLTLHSNIDQLAFSATGQYLLTYNSAVIAGEQPNFLVFATDGSIVFKSTTAKFGTWDRTGNRLYFLASSTVDRISGSVESLDPGAKPVVRSQKLTSYVWPTLSPDGKLLVFNLFGAQQFPHPWRLNLASGVKTQLSSATSTQPVFMSQNVVWSNEGIPCKCAPRGTSQPDGRLIAHNLSTGVNYVVQLGSDFFRPQTEEIVDVWFG